MGAFEDYKKRIRKEIPDSTEYFNYFFNNDYDNAIKVVKRDMDKYNQKYGVIPLELERRLEDAKMMKYSNIYYKNNEKAEELEKEGKIDEAIEVLESNILIHTDTPFTYYHLSSIYQDRNEIDNSIRVLKHGIKNCRKIPNKSHVNSLKRDLEKAKKIKKETKSQRLPSANEKHKQRDKEADDLLKQGKQDEAIKLYEINLNEQTISNNSYSKLFKIYFDSEKYDDAQRVCEQAIEIYKPINAAKVSQYRQYLSKVYNKKEDL